MKIIKEGNIDFAKKIKRFECRKCKTIFEADNREYQYCGNQIDGDCYKAMCPLCKSTVYTE